MNANTTPLSAPTNVTITFVSSDAANPESNRVRRHLEREAAVREVAAAD
jgi:hypothetical protein